MGIFEYEKMKFEEKSEILKKKPTLICPWVKIKLILRSHKMTNKSQIIKSIIKVQEYNTFGRQHENIYPTPAEGGTS